MPTSRVEMPRQRKTLFPFLFSKDKKLVHIVARLQNSPGALAGLLSILGTRVNLIGTTSYNIGGDSAIFSGFAEMISDSGTTDEIEELVSICESVRSSQVWEGSDGLLVDKFHSGIQTSTLEPYIMLPSSSLARTLDKMVKTFGTAGETILYLQGRDFAMAGYETLRPLLGQHPELKLGELSHIYEALGYGSSLVESSDGRTVVTVKDCFECSGQKKNGRTCAFMRGLVTGSIGAALGKEMECEEVRCRLKRDRHCEFVVTPRDNIA